jgi:hypothetical protein
LIEEIIWQSEDNDNLLVPYFCLLLLLLSFFLSVIKLERIY